MRYHIVSGPVVETRVSLLPVKAPRKTRGTRKAGSSSLRKIALNERQEALRLGRIFNANFFGAGYLVTLKYSDGRLPADYEALCKNGQTLMKKLAALCKKAGVELKRVLVNANWSPKRDAPARFHHHVVLNEIPIDLLRELWPEGEIDVRSLRRGDLTDLAAYLYRNVKAEAGKRHWSPSRNLAKPIYTEPVPVVSEEIEPPVGASGIYQEPSFDEDGRQVGSYLRCTMPEPPKVRGSQVIIPKQKKGGRKRERADYQVLR